MANPIPVVRWDKAIHDYGISSNGRWMTPDGHFLNFFVDHRFISEYIELDVYNPDFLYAVLSGGISWHEDPLEGWAFIRHSFAGINPSQCNSFRFLLDEHGDIDELAVHVIEIDKYSEAPSVKDSFNLQDPDLVRLYLTDPIGFLQVTEKEMEYEDSE